MKRFEEYLIEKKGSKGLTIFDVDDTMFVSKARVRVLNKKTKQVKSLTPKEYNDYKLKSGEEWDYGEFKSSKIFYQTATPIGRILQKAKAIIKNATKTGSRVIIVTARADMDDKNLFMKTFEAHGIPLGNRREGVYVERAGNLGGRNAAENKKVVFRKYLKTGEYGRIRLFDDHLDNLKALLSLKKEFPEVEYFAYLVDPKTGRVKTVK
jgi:hypothetical protein